MVEKISILTGLYTKKGTLKSVSFFVGSPSISMFRGGKAAVFFAVPPSGLVLSLQCGCNESLKKRMRAVGTALELGVILHAHIEGSVAQFHGLHQLTIRGKAAHGQARRAQGIPVVIIELIAMAVALPDLRTPITPRHRRSSGDHTGVAAQTEGAAFDQA